MAQISWLSLHAWRHETGIDLEPWQGRLLRRLSADWLVEGNKAQEPDWPAPWVEASALEANREAIGHHLGSVLGGMARRPKRNGLR